MTDDLGGNGHGAGGTPAMRFRSQPNGRPALEVKVPASGGDSTSSPALASTSAANPAAIDWEVPVASWSVGPDRSSPSEPEDPAPTEPEAPAAITPVSAVTPLSARRTGPPSTATPKPVPASTGQAGASPRTSGPVIRHPRRASAPPDRSHGCGRSDRRPRFGKLPVARRELGFELECRPDLDEPGRGGRLALVHFR